MAADLKLYCRSAHADQHALQTLKALGDEFLTGDSTSELCQHKFEDISADLKVCAEKFEPSSLQALRLHEPSDQYPFFPGTYRQRRVKLFNMIDAEFLKQSDRTEQGLGVRQSHL